MALILNIMVFQAIVCVNSKYNHFTYIDQDGLSANDWKIQLLDAVEKILEQERDILKSAMTAFQRRGAPTAEPSSVSVSGTDKAVGTHSLMDCCRQLIEQVGKGSTTGNW